MDLSDAEAMTSNDASSGHGISQGVAGVTFDPSMSVTASPATRTRRDSAGSSVSDASGLFPIYEVPGVSFNMPQVNDCCCIVVELRDLRKGRRLRSLFTENQSVIPLLKLLLERIDKMKC